MAYADNDTVNSAVRNSLKYDHHYQTQGIFTAYQTTLAL